MLCLSLLSIVAIAIYSSALAPSSLYLHRTNRANLPRTTEPPAPASARPRRAHPPGQPAGSRRRRARHWKRAACSRRARALFLATWCWTRCVGGGICGRRRATLARRGPSLSECRRGKWLSLSQLRGSSAMGIWGQANGPGRARLVPGGEIRAQGFAAERLLGSPSSGQGSTRFRERWGGSRRGDASDSATVQRPGLVQGGRLESRWLPGSWAAAREVQGVKRIVFMRTRTGGNGQAQGSRSQSVKLRG